MDLDKINHLHYVIKKDKLDYYMKWSKCPHTTRRELFDDKSLLNSLTKQIFFERLLGVFDENGKKKKLTRMLFKKMQKIIEIVEGPT